MSDTELTTTTDAEQLDGDGSTEPSKIVLDDPDDYHHAERLKEIHQARRRVARALGKIDVYGQNKRRHEAALSHMVVAYVSELEPLMRDSDFDLSLPWPEWDTITDYADEMGRFPEYEGYPEYPNVKVPAYVYRRCNLFLSHVKPILSDDSDEWDV